MNRSDILAKLKDILVESDERYAASIDTITEATNVRETLGIASTGMLYILFSLEEAFGPIFDDLDPASIVTLGDLVDAIEAGLK